MTRQQERRRQHLFDKAVRNAVRLLKRKARDEALIESNERFGFDNPRALDDIFRMKMEDLKKQFRREANQAIFSDGQR